MDSGSGGHNFKLPPWGGSGFKQLEYSDTLLPAELVFSGPRQEDFRLASRALITILDCSRWMIQLASPCSKGNYAYWNKLSINIPEWNHLSINLLTAPIGPCKKNFGFMLPHPDMVCPHH